MRQIRLATAGFVGNLLVATSIVLLSSRALLAVTPQTTVQPVTGVTYVVQTAGIFSDLGSIEMFAGNFAPAGSLIANGSLLPIANDPALYDLLGTTYGGDGVTTFALPNLNGQIPIGSGQGAGLTNRVLGTSAGADSVTLSIAQMPAAVGGSGQSFTNMQPSQPLQYVIATQGIFPSPAIRSGATGGVGQPLLSPQEPLLGQVLLTSAPNVLNLTSGFAAADGQTLSISSNLALFQILGTTYGGDGITTFQLPNLNGRAVIGAGNGAGLTPRNLGDTLGTESTTLTLANLPAPHGSDTAYSNMQPSTALHYMIAVNGIFPSHDSILGNAAPLISDEDPVLGQIALFAGTFAPTGWEFCDGQSLSIRQNTALFSVLGTTYGGDGTTNFDLPDLRGRTGIGADSGSGLNGLQSFSLGEETGTETLQLLPGEIPVLPEPGGIALAAFGFAGFAAWSWRRRKRSD